MKKTDLDSILKKMGINTFDSNNYSDEDRLELLGIDDKELKMLEQMMFCRVNLDVTDYGKIEYKIIELDNLVGINRSDVAENWLEQLFKLHKKINFELFQNKINFEEYVNSLNENSLELPEVIENSDGKYYINGNGKHRLTIAKCLRINTFPVMVIKLK